MIKIELSEYQTGLLKQINVPFDPEKDYDEGDALIELEDGITDYVIRHEYLGEGFTALGNELLDLHAFIVLKYDS